ncbi:iron-containing alcohol dehydrogenase [Pseudomonas qingdaonensis]|nr:iron-containing alcohol dehydrogenase [Pseudomonas qingdaonensis]
MQNTLSALNPQQWTVPLPIEYGPGARHHLARLCRDFNISRPIIITDQGSLRLPFVDELQRSLTEAGLACGLYGGIEPNPTDQSVLAGAAAYRAWGADGIIALGAAVAWTAARRWPWSPVSSAASCGPSTSTSRCRQVSVRRTLRR